MLVRPGQHVGVDGRIYHPYLRDWVNTWERANISELLALLHQIFAKEPPVISKAQQQQYQRASRHSPQPQSTSGASTQAPPQLPPKQRVGSIQASRGLTESTAPPVPPKPGEEYAEAPREPHRDGPPLPPLPHENPQVHTHSPRPPRPNGHQQDTSLHASTHSPLNGRPLAPTLSPLPHMQGQLNRSSVSPISAREYSALSASRHFQPVPPPPPELQQPMQPPLQTIYPGSQALQFRMPYSEAYPQPPHLSHGIPHQGVPQKMPRPTQPPPDLLSDPFDVALGAPSGPAGPAPPIPPNPEKEHLLQAISTSLAQQAQQKVSQTLSAIAPLQAQQQALRAARARLEGEIRQVEHLDQALSSNEAILRRSIQDCDHTIETAKSKKQPPIDEVLVAPTMVATQLWTLCAEEAACRETMYVLQKAVDRGRVSGSDFVRQMRGLGRECFLKMALARKCARGMGLETSHR